MYVKDLIKQLQKLPQDLAVVLSSDEEGNNYSQLDAVTDGFVYDNEGIVGAFYSRTEAEQDAIENGVNLLNVHKVVFIYPRN